MSTLSDTTKEIDTIHAQIVVLEAYNFDFERLERLKTKTRELKKKRKVLAREWRNKNGRKEN